MQKGHERRNGISRQAKYETVSEPAKQERFARLDRYAPHIDPGAERAHGRVHQVVFAYRDTAAHDYNLVLRRRGQCPAQRITVVSAILHGGEDASEAAQEGLQQRRIAVVNLTGLQFFSRLGQLISSRNDPRAHFAADCDSFETLGR